MYSEELKTYITDTAISNKLSRTGNYTRQFRELIEFANNNNESIDSLLLYNISDIKKCILFDLPPPKCMCGKRSSYRMNSNGCHYQSYCSMLCRNIDPLYRKKISDIKTAKYTDEVWKQSVEHKKVKTTLEHYGVKYPMQHVDLFLKQQAACFKKDDDGLHGYEPVIYPYLQMIYPDIVKGTDYIKNTQNIIEWEGADNKLHRSYPDFFSKQLNSFVEIKSEYTRLIHDYKVMKCKDRLHELQFGYFIITVKPKKVYIIEQYNNEYIME